MAICPVEYLQTGGQEVLHQDLIQRSAQVGDGESHGDGLMRRGAFGGEVAAHVQFHPGRDAEPAKEQVEQEGQGQREQSAVPPGNAEDQEGEGEEGEEEGTGHGAVISEQCSVFSGQ